MNWSPNPLNAGVQCLSLNHDRLRASEAPKIVQLVYQARIVLRLLIKTESLHHQTPVYIVKIPETALF